MIGGSAAIRRRDARLLEQVRQSRGAEPRLLRQGDGLQTWRVGRLRLVTPRLGPGLPAELAAALRVWRSALLAGLCPECAQVWHVHRGQVVVPHAGDCAASKGSLRLLLAGRGDATRVVLHA